MIPFAGSIPQAPYIKPKGFLHHLNRIATQGIPDYADSVRNPQCVTTYEYFNFWENEALKIKHGFFIDDIWIPGRFYWYMAYKQMTTIKGVVTPDMIDLHLELAYYIEYCKANGKNLLCAKGRRKGISEAASTMIIDYGWRFTEGYKGGVAAGNKTYVEDFVAKWRFADSRLPPEFSVKKLTDNDDEIVAGYSIKNQYGTYQDGGTFNTIYARTMHNNPNMFKGLYLNDIISEEIGEHEKWIEFFGASKDTLMSGNKQVGMMCAFGTGGNINKGSKDFKKVWHDYEVFNFVRFLIPATRFYFYGNATNDNQKLPKESKLLEQYKSYQLIGCEDRELSEKDILTRRERFLKQGNLKEYNEDLQNNPINEQEIFRKTVVNNFDINVLNKQQAVLDSLTHPRYTKYKLDWVKDDKGMIKTPLEVKWRPITPTEDQDECVWIIDTELPRKGHSDLYTAGCLPPGEKVMTEYGLMNIEDVDMDNYLINDKGDHVRINRLIRHEVKNEPVYKFKMSNTFRTTTFTGEHPLLVSDGVRMVNYKRHHPLLKFNEPYLDFSFEYKKVDSIKPGQWIKVPNIYRKTLPLGWETDFWDTSNCKVDCLLDNPLLIPDFWWFIGLWLGDGWCNSKKNKVTISFNTKEPYYMSRFKSVVKKVFGRSCSSRTRRKSCYEISFSSKQLTRFLNKYFGKFSFGKFIPEWAKYINDDCKKQLIQGLLDSDGSVGIDKKKKFI